MIEGILYIYNLMSNDKFNIGFKILTFK